MRKFFHHMVLAAVCISLIGICAGEAYSQDWEGEDSCSEGCYEEYEEDHPAFRKKKGQEKDLYDLDLLSEGVRLPYTLYYQWPELPTGCEISALAIALSGLGYEITPSELARGYLDYGPDGDMLFSFMGDPFTEEGGGIFPPGLCKAANAYLEKAGSTARAYDITGCSFEDVLNEVAQGNPVVIWATLKYVDPEWVDDGAEYNGISYGWYANEHCLALKGYDREDGLVFFGDPSDGWTEVDFYEAWDLFDQIGYCLVLKDEE